MPSPAADAAPHTAGPPSASAARTQALLTAPVLPLLVRLALPNMGALVAAALTNISETVYVGRLGAGALAGLALVFPMVMLQSMLSAGALGSSVSATIGRALGAGQRDQARTLAVQTFWLALGCGLVYTAFMLTLGESLFRLLGGRGEALQQALAYARVAFMGSAFVWLANLLAAVIRGTGRMNVPSMALLCISMGQLLVGGALGLGWGPLPALGMRGVASGQLVAYGLGSLFLLVHLMRDPHIGLPLLRVPLQPRLLMRIVQTGAVACISPFQTVLTILILTRLVAQFGPETLAGYGVASRLEFLLIPVAFAVGVASVPMIGMAMGARQVQRARLVAWWTATLAGGALGLAGLVVAVWPGLWANLFTSDAAVLAASASYLRWVGPCYAFLGIGLSLYFSAVAAGRASGPVLAGALRLAVVALGGLLLASLATPAWSIYALVALGMVAYGAGTLALVKYASWGQR